MTAFCDRAVAIELLRMATLKRGCKYGYGRERERKKKKRKRVRERKRERVCV